MNCPTLTTLQDCQNIQLIEPGTDELVANFPGSQDPSLSERGEVILNVGQSEVTVNFVIPKASAIYRFEYLYVDALGIILPGIISVVPTLMTAFGFTVELAGAPIGNGYILRWRVVVTALTGPITPPTVDQPESIYVPLPMANVFTYMFLNPRSTQTYGFSELRVENLIDLPGVQTPILAQVVVKLLQQFSVALSPTPNNNNYYLVARTP
jgi:hypothetical protein